MLYSVVKLVAIVFAGLALSACAPEIVRSSISYAQHTGAKETIQFTKSTRIPNSSGTGNTLFVGMRWDLAGEVVHGKVYRSKDSVFFVQGANSHEAYLVIKDKKLVGFYLPGERAWSALGSPLDVEFSLN
jgi:hypothetical protein